MKGKGAAPFPRPLVNKSREEIAYTLIDINSDAQDLLLQEISKIEGVIQVRKL